MPPLEEMDRHQSALLWPTTGTDSFGQPLHDFTVDPLCLTVRWVNKRKMTSDAAGNPVQIDAVVIANRAVATGSLMWEGGLKDVLGTGNTPPSDIMIVIGYDTTKDIKGRFLRRELYLSRYKNTLNSSGRT